MGVLISGCSSGIGKATAIYLKQKGCDVIASARSEGDLHALNELGLKTVKLDVCDSDSIANAIAQATVLSETHQLHGLINNAGYGQAGALEDLSRDALRDQFETNVFGLFELTKLAIPYMLEQGYGRIINISSVLGFISIPLSGAYCASKYAVESLSDTLRLELRGTGIGVSLIEPGPIISHFHQTLVNQTLHNLNISQSAFSDTYERMQNGIDNARPSRFALPPEAVAVKVHQALTARSPKPRYMVTLPTQVMTVLRRLLTSRLLDKTICRAFAASVKRNHPTNKAH